MYSRLTDNQWAKVEPLLVLPRRADGRGRPWNNARSVVDGMLYVRHSGCAWNQLPSAQYPPYQTCHRWFQRFVDDGTWCKVLTAVAQEQGRDVAECFVDGTFVAAKKGAIVSAGDTRAMARP